MRKEQNLGAVAILNQVKRQSSVSQKRNPTQLLSVLLALSGFTGTILAMGSLYQPDLHRGIVLLCAFGYFSVLSLIQLLPKHSGKLTFLGVLLLCFLMLSQTKSIVVGMQSVINGVYQTAYHTEISYFTVSEDIAPKSAETWAGICVSGILAAFFSYFTIRRPHFSITACVSFLLIEPGLYLGLSVSNPAMALLLAYWCGMLAMRIPLARHRGKSRPEKRAAGLCGTITALLVLSVYGATALVGTWSGYTRSAADNQRKQELSDSLADFDIQNLSESFRAVSTALGGGSGHVSLGTKARQRFRNRTDLELTFDNLPDSTMYLKGYTGSVYGDNGWEALSEDAGYTNQEVVSAVLESYDCAPQNFSFLFQQSMLSESATFSCTVTPQRKSSRNYRPYVSYAADVSYPNDADTTPDGRDNYTWTVSAPQSWVMETLSESELFETLITTAQVDDNDTTKAFLQTLGVTDADALVSMRFLPESAATVPEKIQGKVLPAALLESLAYRDFAKAAYTALPESEELDEVFQALPDAIRNAQVRSPEEQYDALCQIRTWMAQQTSYTLSPGKTPRTRDFVNFFLLENQKGYCSHYATAGVILARYLGIPARYCEGYLIGSDVLDSASISEDGYTIEVQDKQAHAWCEFYIDGYGWMPFEMTPGYYQDSTVSANAVTSTTSAAATQPLAESQTEAKTLTSAAGQNAAQTSAPISEAGLASTTVDTDSVITASEKETANPTRLADGWKILAVLLPSGIALMIVGLLWRRYSIAKRQRLFSDTDHPESAVREMYRYLMRLLRQSGLRQQPKTLLEFCETAVRHLEANQLPTDAPKQIIPMVLALEFGKQLPKSDAQLQAAESVQALANSICTSCKPPKRFCMKYLQHLM